MVPELRTPGATSAAKPPLVAVMLPRLTIEAAGLPGMLKLYLPAMKSSLRMSCVEARKPAVVIEERWSLPADHAVERDRRVVRLIEGRVLATAEVERLPVDDEVLACLVDRDRA